MIHYHMSDQLSIYIISFMEGEVYMRQYKKGWQVVIVQFIPQRRSSLFSILSVFKTVYTVSACIPLV